MRPYRLPILMHSNVSSFAEEEYIVFDLVKPLVCNRKAKTKSTMGSKGVSEGNNKRKQHLTGMRFLVPVPAMLACAVEFFKLLLSSRALLRFAATGSSAAFQPRSVKMDVCAGLEAFIPAKSVAFDFHLLINKCSMAPSLHLKQIPGFHLCSVFALA